MSRRLALLALVVLCAGLVPAIALIVPATAAAQSAGDEQYQDPFGGGNGNGGNGNGGNSGGGGGTSQPAPTATPAPSTAQPAVTPTAAGSPAASAAAPGDELPRTGAPVGLVALAGVLLLAGGLALRRHVRDDA